MVKSIWSRIICLSSLNRILAETRREMKAMICFGIAVNLSLSISSYFNNTLKPFPSSRSDQFLVSSLHLPSR